MNKSGMREQARSKISLPFSYLKKMNLGVRLQTCVSSPGGKYSVLPRGDGSSEALTGMRPADVCGVSGRTSGLLRLPGVPGGRAMLTGKE